MHIYERAWQVAANGTYVRQDYAGMTTPLHVISGSAGCIEGSTPFIGTPPAWSAVRFGESTAFGFVTLAFHNSTHARHAFIDAHTGEELDSAWIVRQSAAPPSAAAATSAGSSSSGSSSSRSSSAPLPLLAAPPPPPACRSVLSWPYAAGSIWNTPLGADAQLVPANLFPAAAPSAGVMSDDDYFIVTTAADPLTAWYSQGFWNSTPHCDLFPWSRLVGNLHWPAAMTITAGGNNAAAILQPDGDSLVLTQPIYKCAADAPILSLFDAAHGTGSIRGDGTWGGHGGSALNAIGGSLRVGEVLPGGAPPRHVLKLQLWARDYYYGAAAGANWSTCYTWPALVCDGYFDSGPDAYGGKNPLLRPGSLLALPAAALPALNATLRTEPARQIAWTLANYGGYLCDDTYADRATFNTEHGFSDQFVATWGLGPFEARSGPWFEDVVTLFRALAIVASNSPSAPGGGGAPLQPPPPPMC